jgi:hypothetical protein
MMVVVVPPGVHLYIIKKRNAFHPMSATRKAKNFLLLSLSMEFTS